MLRNPLLLMLIGSLTVGCTAERSDVDHDPDTQASPHVGAGSGGSADKSPDVSESAGSGGDTEASSQMGAHVDASPDAAVAPQADASPKKPSGPCIVTSTYAPTTTWRETWDADKRVKSQHESDAEDSPVELAWRYDAAGRLVAYAGFGKGSYEKFQHDREYDDRGNLKDFRRSYPSKPDLQTPSPAETRTGTAYENEYDAEGRLSASTEKPYGPDNSNATAIRRTFEEDSDGRCHRIETERLDDSGDGTVETRTYDDAGRVLTVERDYTGASFGLGAGRMPCQSVITINEYDSAGRITSKTTKAAPDRGCSEESQELPFFTDSYEYDADGGVRIESVDYLSDVASEMIIVDGREVWVAYGVETRTAGCASIEAEIGASATAECRVR